LKVKLARFSVDFVCEAADINVATMSAQERWVHARKLLARLHGLADGMEKEERKQKRRELAKEWG
jgi:hypothetical protein